MAINKKPLFIFILLLSALAFSFYSLIPKTPFGAMTVVNSFWNSLTWDFESFGLAALWVRGFYFLALLLLLLAGLRIVPTRIGLVLGGFCALFFASSIFFGLKDASAFLEPQASLELGPGFWLVLISGILAIVLGIFHASPPSQSMGAQGEKQQ